MENLSGQCYNNHEGDKCQGKEIEDKSTTRSSSSNGNNARRKSRWDQPETSHSNGSLLSTMERFVQSVDDMNETILVPCRLMDLQFDETFVPSGGVGGGAKSSGMILGGINGFGAGPSAPSSKTGCSNLTGVDLYQFYSVLNNIKSDLMWGRKSQQISLTQNAPIPGLQSPISHSSSAASVISSVSVMTATSSSSAISSSSAAINGGAGEPAASGGHVKGHARRPSTVSTTSSTSASDTEFSELNEDSGVEAEAEPDVVDVVDCAQNVADSFHHHLNGLQQCLCDLTLAADYVTTRYNAALGGIN